ncbi:hypothetical protein AB0H49_28415 [Nocardia sp. NPDC050713]|uniref:hypothetical protein n=1 Tax=Nocardia sp. NPDC050713 TaxID=3154511 RepID=UPI0033D423F1
MVVLLVLALAAVVVVGGSDSGESTATAADLESMTFVTASPTRTPEPWRGVYSMAGVHNACDLVDLSVLAPWGRVLASPPLHKEERPDDSGGGSLRCNTTMEAEHTVRAVVVPASMITYAEFADKYADSASTYADDVKSGIQLGGPDAIHGPVSGLGAEAYFVMVKHNSNPPHHVMYDLFVRDSNVVVKIDAHVGSDHPIDQRDLDAAFQRQARQILDRLRT